MKKELKALDIIEDTRDDLKILRDFDDAVALLRRALTTPTRGDVCKALSEYYKFKVDYCDKAFFLTSGFTNVKFCVYEENGRVFINDSYAVPPHLITLIGRFYEAQENE